MAKQNRFFQNTIAIVYDFDGTLSPQPMQEYTVLPKIGVKPKRFWKEVSRESKDTVSEAMLVYMRLMLHKAEAATTHIGRDDLKRMGKAIKYFPGVTQWFSRINKFVQKEGKGRIKIKHYIISAGLKEILEGSSIKKHFERIYASEYHFNHHDIATFPKLLITDTAKTQYLFRINKGKENLGQSINEHMSPSLRPIPFSNMIYIGDGMTDVPSMAVIKTNGGNTIAVYKKNSRKEKSVCEKLLEVGRAHLIAQADYSQGGQLDKMVKILLRSVIANIEYDHEQHDCRRVHRMFH